VEVTNPEKLKKRYPYLSCAGVVLAFAFCFLCFGRVNIPAIFTLLAVPTPNDLEEDRLFLGGYDSPVGYRSFVVYRDYDVIREYYESELKKQEWIVETASDSTPTGTMYCLKIEKFMFLRAHIEIYGSTAFGQTKVYIVPFAGYSTCQNNFE
jgi:hypothetical protein